jgi:hypothetical protein
MTTLSLLLFVSLALYSILFWFLYLCVVLLRINDAQVKVQRPGILFRQQSYIARYLSLLSKEDKLRWYNIFLKHSLSIGLVISTAFFFTVLAIAFGGVR